MAFLRSTIGQEAGHVVHGRGVWLRYPTMSDYAPWAELRTVSRDHLVPWEPRWPRDELTRTAFRRRIRHDQREAREDLGYAFLVLAEGSGTLLGGLTLSNVRRGVTQSATLGYWLGKPYLQRGYMTEAVAAIIPFCFDELGLHRIEAATMPCNIASRHVLERNGFKQEGLARSYLKINGIWQDHVLHALIVDDDQCDTRGEDSGRK